MKYYQSEYLKMLILAVVSLIIGVTLETWFFAQVFIIASLLAIFLKLAEIARKIDGEKPITTKPIKKA